LERSRFSRAALIAALAAGGVLNFAGLGSQQPESRTTRRAEGVESARTGVTAENFESKGWKGLKGRQIPKGFETWTDYTRYALEGIKVHGPVGPTADEAKNRDFRPMSLVDRKRSMGVDFGPSFCGLALSLGGVNTMPLGTLRTGKDWKRLAIRIAKIASTQRIKDIVIGQPLNLDGTEGKISKLARYFAQLVADACLLMLGSDVTVFMWDERYSTTYAAFRLGNRPRFDGEAFKRWITVKHGLNWGAKALLDAEAARAILEHWLARDERSEIMNKELSERIPPSREACLRYLKYRKVKALLPQVEVQPEEPAGPGKEGWEWYDRHPESYDVDEETHQSATTAYTDYMKGLDGFGEKERELEKAAEERARQKAIRERIKSKREESEMRQAFRDKAAEVQKQHKGLNLPKEKWNKYGPR